MPTARPIRSDTTAFVSSHVKTVPCQHVMSGQAQFAITIDKEAKVATGYVRHDMADDTQLDLTVRLGTTRLGVRRIGELAVGEVISLGRPLAGPYEIHVAGRRIGEGELVDIDGEVGVRIVSLTEE